MGGVLAGLIGSFGLRRLFTVRDFGATFYRQITGSATYASFPTNKYFFISLGAANQTYVYRSTNGTTWTQSSESVGNGALASNSSLIVAVFGQTHYTSTDGITWTARSGTNAGDCLSIIWDGSRFISLSAYSGSTTPSFYYSPNGTATWLSLPVGFTGTGGALMLQHSGAGQYLATRRSSTTSARYCNGDPTVSGNWVASTLPSAGFWSGIAYGAGTWVACRAGSNAYATSTNGTTWTARTLPSLFSETTAAFAKITFANGKFWYYYTDAVYSSADGITWETETVSGGTLDNVAAWIYDGTKLFGFGADTLALSGAVGSTNYLEGTI